MATDSSYIGENMGNFDWDIFKKNFDPTRGEDLKILMGSKKYFVLSFWRHKFPNSCFDDYEELMKIINKSKSLQKWYSDISSLYGYYHEQPEWVLLNPDLRDKWLTDSASVFENFKNKRKELVERRKKIVASIERQLSEIEAEEESIVTKFYTEFPLVAINKIPTQGLPEHLFSKHLDKMGEEMDRALENELESYKSELARRFIVEDGDKKELMELLKEQT
jgi:hypothetical protein